MFFLENHNPHQWWFQYRHSPHNNRHQTRGDTDHQLSFIRQSDDEWVLGRGNSSMERGECMFETHSGRSWGRRLKVKQKSERRLIWTFVSPTKSQRSTSVSTKVKRSAALTRRLIFTRVSSNKIHHVQPVLGTTISQFMSCLCLFLVHIMSRSWLNFKISPPVFRFRLRLSFSKLSLLLPRSPLSSSQQWLVHVLPPPCLLIFFFLISCLSLIRHCYNQDPHLWISLTVESTASVCRVL